MSSRVKSYLLLGFAVMAGATIGIVATSAWQHHRNMTLLDVRHSGGLYRHMDRMIEFIDEDQRQQVRLALLRGEQSFIRHRRRMIDSLAYDRQVLIDDLQLILNPDQLQRVERWLDRRRSVHQRRRGRKSRSHHPHSLQKDSLSHRTQTSQLE
ncbi:MAG: hypothetical protein OXF84_03105 [Bacteroidetes bacterium]|nr:hypothetical protein [Bacteroidota bacterium]